LEGTNSVRLEMQIKSSFRSLWLRAEFRTCQHGRQVNFDVRSPNFLVLVLGTSASPLGERTLKRELADSL
jgi:hypothetical protein